MTDIATKGTAHTTDLSLWLVKNECSMTPWIIDSLYCLIFAFLPGIFGTELSIQPRKKWTKWNGFIFRLHFTSGPWSFNLKPWLPCGILLCDFSLAEHEASTDEVHTCVTYWHLTTQAQVPCHNTQKPLDPIELVVHACFTAIMAIWWLHHFVPCHTKALGVNIFIIIISQFVEKLPHTKPCHEIMYIIQTNCDSLFLWQTLIRIYIVCE